MVVEQQSRGCPRAVPGRRGGQSCLAGGSAGPFHPFDGPRPPSNRPPPPNRPQARLQLARQIAHKMLNAGMSAHPDFENIRTLGQNYMDPSMEPARWGGGCTGGCTVGTAPSLSPASPPSCTLPPPRLGGLLTFCRRPTTRTRASTCHARTANHFEHTLRPTANGHRFCIPLHPRRRLAPH